MLDKFINILSDIWSEEKIELVSRANDVFKSYEYETIGVVVEYVLSKASTQNSEDIIMQIQTLIEENLDILILNHGIVLQGATVKDKIAILEAISMIEDFDDMERVYFLINDDTTDNDERDRFLEVISYVSGIPLHVYDPYVWSVHNSFLERISKTAEAKLTDFDYELLEPPSLERIELFKKYLTTYGRGAHSLAMAAGFRMNINFNFLLDQMVNDIQQLEPMDPKQAAIEIIGLMLLSDIKTEEMRKRGNEVVASIYTNASFKTSTLSLMAAVFAEVGING